MAAQTCDVGTGTTLLFGTSGFSMQVTNVNHTGINRGQIESTHLGTTTARTFKPKRLYDPGQLEIEGHYDPSKAAPITGAVEVITVTYPNGETKSFSGFLTDFRDVAPLEERMSFSATIKATGALTGNP